MFTYSKLYHSFIILSLFSSPNLYANEQASALIKAAIDYWRGNSSYSVSEMTIHRSDWQRSMTLRVWTQDMKNSLVRVLKPAKDKGNATLTKNSKMWSFSPKINRVIKIPSSMMSQSWMGSDFSNNDVAKADTLLEHYTHNLKDIETHEGKQIFVIEAVPFENSPVVWGKEVLKIREDYIILEHIFYDQDQIIVKKMITKEIKKMGGKLIASTQRMQKIDKPKEWTEIVVKEAKFNLELSNHVFSLSNLRNPRN